MRDLTEIIRTLPLKDLHEAAGAKFGDFAGWKMPLTYPLGVMKEHLHTRQSAGLFDISHMKLIEISGEESEEFLSYALPIDAKSLALYQSRYNYLLNEDAGILDDLIVTRLGDKRFIIAANAGNAEADIEEFNKRAKDFSCVITPLDRVFLALQGPKAQEVMQDNAIDIGTLTFMQGFEPKKDWFIARSGYTGEDGFEIALPLEDAQEVAQKLAADARVEWIGLAARDSLRLEAGLCLHGNDITVNNNPVEAGLLWAVPKKLREEGRFIGAKALLKIIQSGAQRRRVGLKPETRQPVRSNAKIYNAQGEEIGVVTSGGFGPSFEGPVAMGYVAIKDAEIGNKVYTKIRDREVALIVHKLPFVQQNYFKG